VSTDRRRIRGTSTPPAYAVLARTVTMKTAQCRLCGMKKMREIKGLTHKIESTQVIGIAVMADNLKVAVRIQLRKQKYKDINTL
jgi:tryptophanase